jgi:hypothetical protein
MSETIRGGPGRGQGRKAIAESGELMKARPVRMTEEQWQKCKDLGGAAWVRRMIDQTKAPNLNSPTADVG